MYFVVFATDRPGHEDVRAATREAHRAYIRSPRAPVRLVHGGPTLDAGTRAMNGTLLIVEAADIADVRAFVAEDPYGRAGLFETVEVRPWSWGFGAPADPR